MRQGPQHLSLATQRDKHPKHPSPWIADKAIGVPRMGKACYETRKFFIILDLEKSVGIAAKK